MFKSEMYVIKIPPPSVLYHQSHSIFLKGSESGKSSTPPFSLPFDPNPFRPPPVLPSSETVTTANVPSGEPRASLRGDHVSPFADRAGRHVDEGDPVVGVAGPDLRPVGGAHRLSRGGTAAGGGAVVGAAAAGRWSRRRRGGGSGCRCGPRGRRRHGCGRFRWRGSAGRSAGWRGGRRDVHNHHRRLLELAGLDAGIGGR